MSRVATIGSLLKRIYRLYSNELLGSLQSKGFTDLRPSFLEVLLYICDHEGPSIKDIGLGCGLKKQTMTSHLNELEKRGYVVRRNNPNDKREQNIYLTDYGEKFRLAMLESIQEIEKAYSDLVGDVELERVEMMLKNFHRKTDSMQGSLPLGSSL